MIGVRNTFDSVLHELYTGFKSGEIVLDQSASVKLSERPKILEALVDAPLRMGEFQARNDFICEYVTLSVQVALGCAVAVALVYVDFRMNLRARLLQSLVIVVLIALATYICTFALLWLRFLVAKHRPTERADQSPHAMLSALSQSLVSSIRGTPDLVSDLVFGLLLAVGLWYLASQPWPLHVVVLIGAIAASVFLGLIPRRSLRGYPQQLREGKTQGGEKTASETRPA